MISKLTPDPKEIINLISRLKIETPEYPVDMFAARKAAYLKHIAMIKIQPRGPGGEGGQQSGSGSSGSALGGSTTAQSIVFKALIGFGLVATMLIGSLFLRQPVNDLLDGMIAVSGSEPSEQVAEPETIVISTPDLSTLPPVYLPTVAPTELVTIVTESVPIVDDVINSVTLNNEKNKDKKPNPGLHLGQAEGTPAAPGHGNPGNINKPEKPEKPPKPEKPETGKK